MWLKDLSSSPVGPCASGSSGWLQTFSFLCQSSGRGSYIGASSAWPTSAVKSEEKTWTISGLNWTFKSPQYTVNQALFTSDVQYVSTEAQEGPTTKEAALQAQTFILWGSTAPWMLLVSRVSRVGLLYTLSTSSGAVLRWFARSNDSTEETQ